MNTNQFADKPYDSALDAKTAPIIKTVYAAILLYAGATHVADEPTPGVGLKFISDKHCEKGGIQKAFEFEVRGTADGFDPFGYGGVRECSPWIHTLARKDWLDADLYIPCSFTYPFFAVCRNDIIKKYQITTIEACNSNVPLNKRDVPTYEWDVYLYSQNKLHLVQKNRNGVAYLHSLWDSSKT